MCGVSVKKRRSKDSPVGQAFAVNGRKPVVKELLPVRGMRFSNGCRGGAAQNRTPKAWRVVKSWLLGKAQEAIRLAELQEVLAIDVFLRIIS